MKGFLPAAYLIPTLILSSGYASTIPGLDKLALSGSIGYMEIEAREYVYNTSTDTKLSQLNWVNDDGIAVIRGEANYPILPFLDLNARGWINLGNGGSVMDDYDWLIPNQIDPSHHSHHPNTTLRQANQYDLSARFWLYQDAGFRFGASAGYQRYLSSFLAKGGCYSYLNGASTGCFDDELSVIGYKQTYSSPYIGILAAYAYNRYEFSGSFQFSNLVSAKDVDQHYLRSLTFYDQGRNFQYYYGALNAGYFYRPEIKIFIEAAFTYLPTDSADTLIYDASTQTTTYLPRGAAGLSNKNTVIALGVQYYLDGKLKETTK